jgi:hypothetical protein
MDRKERLDLKVLEERRVRGVNLAKMLALRLLM